MNQKTFLSLLTASWDRFDRWLCRTLPGSLRVEWARLWIREDEFHPSLDSYAEFAVDLPIEARRFYSEDLCRRRMIAHHRDLARATAIATKP
jgi:hypothetical protein